MPKVGRCVLVHRGVAHAGGDEGMRRGKHLAEMDAWWWRRVLLLGLRLGRLG